MSRKAVVFPAPEAAPAPAPQSESASEPEPAMEPAPEPAAVDPKPAEHPALRDLDRQPADDPPDPAPADPKPFEHQALRDIEPAPEPPDDEPRGDGDGPLPPHGGVDPRLWAHLPQEDRDAIREEQQRDEDERQLREWEQNPPDYVAMGDSYSAGTGTIPDGENPAGQRTEDAYGPEIAEARNYDIEHVAYGGATTENVLGGQGDEPPQVDALTASTDVVTISIGGNDVGFSDVAGECGNPLNSDDDCLERVDEAQAYIEDELPARLDEIYAQIDTRAPEAEVIVDPRMTFEGHGVGSDEEYLNGISADWGRTLDGDPPVDDDSFHPNEAGYDALGELVTEQLED